MTCSEPGECTDQQKPITERDCNSGHCEQAVSEGYSREEYTVADALIHNSNNNSTGLVVTDVTRKHTDNAGTSVANERTAARHTRPHVTRRKNERLEKVKGHVLDMFTRANVAQTTLGPVSSTRTPLAATTTRAAEEPRDYYIWVPLYWGEVSQQVSVVCHK